MGSRLIGQIIQNNNTHTLFDAEKSKKKKNHLEEGAVEAVVMLRLIRFRCLFIASEDVTLSTAQAEARMCRSVSVVRRSLSVALCHAEDREW